MNYLHPTEEAAQDTAAAIFSIYREQIHAIDPDAIAPDGSIIGRNAATGELKPNATRTTAWASPIPMVQGYAIPVPAEPELHLDDHQPITTANPWPYRTPAGAPPPLPEWQQPTGAHDAYILGAWVTHQGADYCSLLAANVWEPSPESNFWRISPDPGPLPWQAPTGSADAYAIGDRVTHAVEGRETDLWESNIAANTTEPGTDGTYDRWWKPIAGTGGEVSEWVQPMPGTANAPYEVDAVVMFQGSAYRNTVPLNVWPPAGTGSHGWVLNDPVRARDDIGRFVADDPATPDINEAWIEA